MDGMKSRWRRGAVNFFNLGGKLGGGVFKKLSLKLKLRLPDNCFQPEVAVIKIVVDLLLRSTASLRKMSIHSDSRAAIIALRSLTVRSKLVKEHLSS